MMKKIFPALILLAAFLFPSCGYSTSSLLVGKYKTINVKPFKNKIVYGTETRRNLYLPLMEVKVTNGVIDRFLLDGHLKVTDADRSDLVLTGELIDYDRQALRYTDDNDVQEYRINITVSISLYDAAQDKVLWTENNLVGDTTYFTVGSQAKSENVAVEDAVTDVARRIVERTIENW